MLGQDAHLLAKHDGIAPKAAFRCSKQDLGCIDPTPRSVARAWHHDNCLKDGVELVAADDYGRTDATLLRAFHWIEAGVVDLTPHHLVARANCSSSARSSSSYGYGPCSACISLAA